MWVFCLPMGKQLIQFYKFILTLCSLNFFIYVFLPERKFVLFSCLMCVINILHGTVISPKNFPQETKALYRTNHRCIYTDLQITFKGDGTPQIWSSARKQLYEALTSHNLLS